MCGGIIVASMKQYCLYRKEMFLNLFSVADVLDKSRESSVKILSILLTSHYILYTAGVGRGNYHPISETLHA